MNLPRQDDREFLRSKVRPQYEEGSGEVKVVDLFSGCGGMALGVAHAAHLKGKAVRVPLAIDEDEDAIGVFGDNFANADCHRDDVCEWFDGALEDRITGAERRTRAHTGSGVHFLLGGPPCQGNSNLNNHTRRNDPRNALYARMARAARVLEAKFVIVENVADVLKDQGKVVEATKEALDRYGYRVHDAVVDLWPVGVPQRRRRHILFASRDHEVVPTKVLEALQDDTERHGRDLRWAISDLERVAPEGGFDSPSIPKGDNVWRMKWLFDEDEYDLPNDLRPPCHRDNPGHTYYSVYGRLRWDQPAPTITTGFGSMGQGRYVHPSQRRTITPHEAARIQTFPDFFDFGATHKRTAWARMIGNAVPPLLTMRIAEHALGSVGATDRKVAPRSHERQAQLSATG
ncbi:DNA cytosine methyltransferase [Rubrobacter marinus]|uniref:DNA cytosine methyltransferase n=1 Tax=Rubrobacter marinus TaxID=2653852 RepID=UPI0014073CB7|nr:DNA cytosine methyltransferase [Rubrobacter marinus]